MKIISIIAAILICSIINPVLSQDAKELSMEFSDPSAAKFMEVHVFNANITIIGSDRTDVLLTYSNENVHDEDHDNDKTPKKAKGMKKIAGKNVGFVMEERRNTISIRSQNVQSSMIMTIEVPKNINLDIRKQIGEDVSIENINGIINVECNIGSVTAKKISGAISASSTTGDVVVDFTEVNSETTMQFTSITGDIDLTLPTSFKADLKLRTEWGDVYSDHDIAIRQEDSQPKESKDKKGMKVVTNEWTTGSINGGGKLKLICNTKMGNIYLRQ